MRLVPITDLTTFRFLPTIDERARNHKSTFPHFHEFYSPASNFTTATSIKTALQRCTNTQMFSKNIGINVHFWARYLDPGMPGITFSTQEFLHIPDQVIESKESWTFIPRQYTFRYVSEFGFRVHECRNVHGAQEFRYISELDLKTSEFLPPNHATQA